MNNVIATIIKFSSQGASACASAIAGVHKAASVATKGMATLASSLGSLGGPLGNAASQVANFIFSVRQMGAVGGIIAGAQMAISLACEQIIKSYDKMLEKVESAGEKIRDRLKKIDDSRLGKLKDELDAATVKANEAAKAFDTMAAAYLKIENAKAGTNKSVSNSVLSGIALEKSTAMAGAKDDKERAMIGAGYDVRIAREKLIATTGEQSAAVASAEDKLSHSIHRARASKETENAAKRAMDDAASELATMENAGRDEAELDKYRAAKEAAEKAYAAALNDRIAKEADEKAAQEELIQAKLAQTSALNEAKRAVVEAESNEKQLVIAQSKVAEAELKRAAAVRDEEEKARREAEDEERRKTAEKNREEAKLRHEKAIADIDKSIAAAKERAAKLEENALRARGKSADDWLAGERGLAREKRSDATAKRVARSERELENLEAMNPRAMSKWQRNRLAKLREWKADQDPNNNPELKAAKNLEQKREQMIADQLKELKEINANLKAATQL